MKNLTMLMASAFVLAITGCGDSEEKEKKASDAVNQGEAMRIESNKLEVSAYEDWDKYLASSASKKKLSKMNIEEIKAGRELLQSAISKTEKSIALRTRAIQLSYTEGVKWAGRESAIKRIESQKACIEDWRKLDQVLEAAEGRLKSSKKTA